MSTENEIIADDLPSPENLAVWVNFPERMNKWSIAGICITIRKDIERRMNTSAAVEIGELHRITKDNKEMWGKLIIKQLSNEQRRWVGRILKKEDILQIPSPKGDTEEYIMGKEPEDEDPIVESYGGDDDVIPVDPQP